MTFGRTQTERREQREAERERNLRSLCIPSKAIGRGVYTGSTAGAAPKGEKAKGGKAEAAHKAALSQLGCMVCRRIFPWVMPGEVELHHLRGGGWGKGDWTTLIPLCTEHHRGLSGVHGMGTKGFAKCYGFDQADLLADTLALAPLHHG